MDAIVGNHDLRIAKATQGQITIDMLIEDTPLQIGQYSYLYLFNPAKKEWTYVCHQFNYSKTSVKLAQDVWTVVTAPDGYDNDTGERILDYDPALHGPNRQKCNVVVTHTHIAQAGFSPDGAWNCIGMGCMRDQRRTKYTQARATKFPRWNNAFVMYRNGFFTPLTMHHTDWRTVLGKEDNRTVSSSGGPGLKCRDRILQGDLGDRRSEILPFWRSCNYWLTSVPRGPLTRTTKPVTPRYAALAALASLQEDSAMLALVARLRSPSLYEEIRPADGPIPVAIAAPSPRLSTTAALSV